MFEYARRDEQFSLEIIANLVASFYVEFVDPRTHV
jgi:hypothetical protein